MRDTRKSHATIRMLIGKVLIFLGNARLIEPFRDLYYPKIFHDQSPR